MKSNRLAALVPVVLEAIGKIEQEWEQKQEGEQKTKMKSKPEPPDGKELSTAPIERDEKIREGTHQARAVCQLWEDKSKILSQDDVWPVMNLLVKVVAAWFSRPEKNERVFIQEKNLLDLMDQILTGWEDHHPVCPFQRIYVQYYRSLCYMKEVGDDFATVEAELRKTLAIRCDTAEDRYQQIQLLNSLYLNSVRWLGQSHWKESQRDKIAAFICDFVLEMAGLYEKIAVIPAPSHWDLSTLYGDLVGHILDILIHHYAMRIDSIEIAEHYLSRMGELMVRLCYLLDFRSQVKPSEETGLQVAILVVEFLETVKKQEHHEFRDWIIHVAEDFLSPMRSAKILGYQILIASFKPSVKKIPLSNEICPSFQCDEKYSVISPRDEKNQPIERHCQQIKEIKQAAKKREKNLTRKNKRLRQRLEQLKVDSVEWDSVLKKGETRIADLTNENAELASRLADQLRQNTALEQTRVELTESLRCTTADQQQREAEQIHQTERQQAQRREQETALTGALTENGPLRIQAAEVQALLEKRQAEVEQAKCQLEEARRQIDRQTVERQQHKDQVFAQVQALQEELNRLMGGLTASNLSINERLTFS